MGGSRNKRLLEAIQNYHYLVQAQENLVKFNTENGKSNFYWSFLHILKQNNLIVDDVQQADGNLSNASQHSKRIISDINGNQIVDNRSETSQSEESVTKKRRIMREHSNKSISLNCSIPTDKDITLLIEDSTLARCDYCKYPLSNNRQTTFVCNSCNKSFHFRCVWGELYLGEEMNWKLASKYPRIWLCGSCLVSKSIMIYYKCRNEWVNVFVVSYKPRSRTHVVKWRQDIRLIALRNWRVRLCEDVDTIKRNIQNTLSNESVISKKDGVRYYKQMPGWNQVESLGYHSFPQIVLFELNK